MSYNRMTNPDEIAEPVNNEERYPQAPSQTKPGENANPSNTIGMDAANIAPMLESGLIIMHNPNTMEQPKNMMFTEDSIRKGFIRKVYMILLVQLLFTCGIIAVFLYHEPTKYFVQKHQEVVISAFIVNFVVLLSMACCESARRTFPVNFVCLALFTATMSLLLGAISSKIDANLVLMAVGITAVLVIALSIFAIQTKYDFTAWRGVLICCVVCLIMLAFAGGFLRRTFGELAISILGALIASFLLIYDTQLIIGGEHKYQFNPEDYIFAALTLYVDCVRIFLYVLRFLKR